MVTTIDGGQLSQVEKTFYELAKTEGVRIGSTRQYQNYIIDNDSGDFVEVKNEPDNNEFLRLTFVDGVTGRKAQFNADKLGEEGKAFAGVLLGALKAINERTGEVYEVTPDIAGIGRTKNGIEVYTDTSTGFPPFVHFSAWTLDEDEPINVRFSPNDIYELMDVLELLDSCEV